MTHDYHEKEFDDEVYEDNYYEGEEELEDDDSSSELSLAEDDDENDSESKDEELRVHVSFVCEDCDYRWDDVIIKMKGSFDDQDNDHEGLCSMCGSINVTQI